MKKAANKIALLVLVILTLSTATTVKAQMVSKLSKSNTYFEIHLPAAYPDSAVKYPRLNFKNGNPVKNLKDIRYGDTLIVADNVTGIIPTAPICDSCFDPTWKGAKFRKGDKVVVDYIKFCAGGWITFEGWTYLATIRAITPKKIVKVYCFEYN